MEDEVWRMEVEVWGREEVLAVSVVNSLQIISCRMTIIPSLSMGGVVSASLPTVTAPSSLVVILRLSPVSLCVNIIEAGFIFFVGFSVGS